MLSEPLLVVVRIATVFDRLQIPYLVGGSLASSLYGIPRATQDVDLVAGLDSPRVEPLTTALRSDFYVDAEMIQDAIRRRSSFNVIHLETMFKVDIFVQRDDAWSCEEMARARMVPIETEEGLVSIRFASPEDMLLHKPVWYRLGNQVSDRQWSDVLGILKVQGEWLDTDYLDRWAPLLKVDDLLGQARGERSG
ncbi:MAG: hypothetical protein JW797_13395 [Bradymonadales bacterium]|nr:hypothetical protein [Bradymonadales bacterium]